MIRQQLRRIRRGPCWRTVFDRKTIFFRVLSSRHGKNNSNSTDAALLTTLLRYAQTTSETCVLIAADARFCRSAQAEGLTVLNPELVSLTDVPAFLAVL